MFNKKIKKKKKKNVLGLARNNTFSIFMIQNEIEKLLIKDKYFKENNKNLDYCNVDNKSKIANTLYCINVNHLGNKFWFTKLFNQQSFSTEKYLFSNKETPLRKHMDFYKYEINSFKSKEYCNWYVKPVGGASGKGIIITKNPEKLEVNQLPPNIYVIEKEIIPMLTKKRKFDIRLHVMISYYNNKLEVYMPNDCLCRICPKKFNESSNDKDTKITNLFQRENSVVDKYQKPLSKLFSKKKYISLMKKIKKVIYNSSKIIEKKIENNYKSEFINEYHLFGYDIMFDKNEVPYIIEINNNPDIFDIFHGDDNLKGLQINKDNTIQEIITEDIFNLCIKQKLLKNFQYQPKILEKVY